MCLYPSQIAIKTKCCPKQMSAQLCNKNESSIFSYYFNVEVHTINYCAFLFSQIILLRDLTIMNVAKNVITKNNFIENINNLT